MSKNPSVNRSLADKDFDRIDHALGRPIWPTRETYRNYFATDSKSGLALRFDQSRYWAKSGQQGDMAFYHVTAAGISALVEHLAIYDRAHAFEVTFSGHSRIVPALTAAKARYDYYLALCDVLPDLKFIDFSRAARVRRAA